MFLIFIDGYIAAGRPDDLWGSWQIKSVGPKMSLLSIAWYIGINRGKGAN